MQVFASFLLFFRQNYVYTHHKINSSSMKFLGQVFEIRTNVALSSFPKTRQARQNLQNRGKFWKTLAPFSCRKNWFFSLTFDFLTGLMQVNQREKNYRSLPRPSLVFSIFCRIFRSRTVRKQRRISWGILRSTWHITLNQRLIQITQVSNHKARQAVGDSAGKQAFWAFFAKFSAKTPPESFQKNFQTAEPWESLICHWMD